MTVRPHRLRQAFLDRLTLLKGIALALLLGTAAPGYANLLEQGFEVAYETSWRGIHVGVTKRRLEAGANDTWSFRSENEPQDLARLVTSIVSEVVVKRGADTACCASMSKSMTFRMACRFPIVIVVPPGAPTSRIGSSPLKTIVGDIAEKRALPGASDPGFPGLGSKTIMQLLYMKPSPSVMQPADEPSEWVMLTQLP